MAEEMDRPEPRPVQPPEVGEVVDVWEAGGLYRFAAISRAIAVPAKRPICSAPCATSGTGAWVFGSTRWA